MANERPKYGNMRCKPCADDFEIGNVAVPKHAVIPVHAMV
jgi:hypothetical protein